MSICRDDDTIKRVHVASERNRLNNHRLPCLSFFVSLSPFFSVLLSTSTRRVGPVEKMHRCVSIETIAQCIETERVSFCESFTVRLLQSKSGIINMVKFPYDIVLFEFLLTDSKNWTQKLHLPTYIISFNFRLVIYYQLSIISYSNFILSN